MAGSSGSSIFNVYYTLIYDLTVIHGAHILPGVQPSKGARRPYQGPHPQRKLSLAPQ